MLDQAPRLQVYAPTNGIMPGWGFYQLEDDTLYVPIGAPKGRHFFSYIESEYVRLDLDKMGRLLLFEVDFPRRRWTTIDDMKIPTGGVSADLRWLDFRETIKTPEILTDDLRQTLQLRFSRHTPSQTYNLADEIILQADEDDRVVSIFVSLIYDDLAGQGIKHFRQQIRFEEDRRKQLAQA